MLRSLVLRVTVLALLLLMQGPAMLVQEVAWVRMLVTYSHDRGLARGVVETFDGAHPCPMCAKAAKLRQEERKSDPSGQIPASLKRLLWMDMVASSHSLQIRPSSKDWSPSGFVTPRLTEGRGANAPVPPPPEVV